MTHAPDGWDVVLLLLAAAVCWFLGPYMRAVEKRHRERRARSEEVTPEA